MWFLATPLRTSPSRSAHNAGFSSFTSPTKPLINCDQGQIACEKSLPQPCDIHSISSLSRAFLKMLTWLIRPINCPAWGSSFAKSSVRPIINSPPPIEHKVAVRFLKASFTFSLGEYFFYLLAYDENMYCLVLRDKCYKQVLLSKSHLSFFNFRYRCFLSNFEEIFQ